MLLARLQKSKSTKNAKENTKNIETNLKRRPKKTFQHIKSPYSLLEGCGGVNREGYRYRLGHTNTRAQRGDREESTKTDREKTLSSGILS